MASNEIFFYAVGLCKIVSVHLLFYNFRAFVWTQYFKKMFIILGRQGFSSLRRPLNPTSEGLKDSCDQRMASIHWDFTEKIQFMPTQSSTEQLPVLNYVISQVVRTALYYLKEKRKDSFNIISSSIFQSNNCVMVAYPRQAFLWDKCIKRLHAEVLFWLPYGNRWINHPPINTEPCYDIFAQLDWVERPFKIRK